MIYSTNVSNTPILGTTNSHEHTEKHQRPRPNSQYTGIQRAWALVSIFNELTFLGT